MLITALDDHPDTNLELQAATIALFRDPDGTWTNHVPPKTDYNQLRAQGAFEVPTIALQNALVRSYVDQVHTFLSILHLEAFLEFILGPEPSTSVAFADLRGAGFQSRKDAQMKFYATVTNPSPDFTPI
ncbi:hypothetical protein BJX62DRAFT_238584 [Aspergillus germanicus]